MYSWMCLPFGKYRGKSLAHALMLDPDWFYESILSGVFDRNPMLRGQSSELFRLARRVRAPILQGVPSIVEYSFVETTRRFVCFKCIPRSGIQTGNATCYYKNYIDFFYPKDINPLDVTSGRQLMQSFLHYYGETEKAAITESFAHSFFADENKFEAQVSVSKGGRAA